VVNIRNWPGAGAAIIEIRIALLPVRVMLPMSGLEHAGRAVDWLLRVFWSQPFFLKPTVKIERQQ